MEGRPKTSVKSKEGQYQLKMNVKQLQDENSSLKDSLHKLNKVNEELEEKYMNLWQLFCLAYVPDSDRIQLVEKEKENILNESRSSSRKQIFISLVLCLLSVLVLGIVWKNFM